MYNVSYFYGINVMNKISRFKIIFLVVINSNINKKILKIHNLAKKYFG